MAPGRRARIGIDLGGTKIEGVALAEDGALLARQRIATPRGDYDATIAAIAGLVHRLAGEAGDPQATVGIGIPGVVSPKSGLVKNANSTWLIGHPLDADVAAVIGRPVRTQNDANCFAVSEASDGAAAGCHTVFGVIVGTGCGGGIVIGGKVLTGRNAIAGEWGHNPLPWPQRSKEWGDETPGPECYCGRRGCIERFCCGPAFEDDHARATGQLLSAPDIVAALRAGDAAARASLDRYVDRLARALAALINIVDPDAVVLGGGMSNVAELYRELPPALQRWCFSDGIDTPILPARHGDSSGVRGAAWLWGLDERA